MDNVGPCVPRPLDYVRVRQGLRTEYVAHAGASFVYLPAIDSTNSYARTLARQAASSGSVVITDNQTAGRGRLGRTWEVPPFTALTFSVILHNPGGAESRGLVMAAALAIYDLARNDLALSPRLKWPNDILLGGRKVSGILIENVGEPTTRDLVPPEGATERASDAVVGIGLNVNATPAEFQDRATCLSAARGQFLEREDILIALLQHLDTIYARLLTQPAAVWQRWRTTLETLGSSVDVYYPDGSVLHGVAEDVSLAGALLVRDQNGHLHSVHAGDVTLTRPPSAHAVEG